VRLRGYDRYTKEIRPANANIVSKVERYYLPGRLTTRASKATIRAARSTMKPHPDRAGAQRPPFPEYGVAVAGHIIDFALQVRGVQDSEFDEQGAPMSLMMEVAARESVLQNGARINLPLEGELESDRLMTGGIKKRYGVDPLDLEAMMAPQI
jgi:hypothetical protein